MLGANLGSGFQSPQRTLSGAHTATAPPSARAFMNCLIKRSERFKLKRKALLQLKTILRGKGDKPAVKLECQRENGIQNALKLKSSLETLHQKPSFSS